MLAERNIHTLKKNGYTILLIADPEIILNRLRQDPITEERRPPLSEGPWDQEIRELVKMRSPLYMNAADHVIDTTSLDVEEVVDAIIQWWEGTR